MANWSEEFELQGMPVCDNCGMPCADKECGCEDNEDREVQPARHKEAIRIAMATFDKLYHYDLLDRMVESYKSRKERYNAALRKAREAYIKTWDDYAKTHDVPDWPPWDGHTTSGDDDDDYVDSDNDDGNGGNGAFAISSNH